MKQLYFIGTSLAVLMLLVTACSPQATPMPAPAATAMTVSTAAPADTATTAPTLPPQATPSGPASIKLGKNDVLGSYVVDDNNKTLYMFNKDTSDTSNCYNRCAAVWPPLLTNGAPLSGTGLDASKLGTITRKEGTMQVTYNHWPLYYYAKDANPGDTVGQGINSVWYVVGADGAQNTTMPAATPTVAPASASAAGTMDTVMLAKNGALGSFLVDNKNMTLYLFTKDTPGVSNCYNGCATAWPPLLVTGSPTVGTGLDAAKLGTTKRKDGSLQVTYNGWPLYYYDKDTAPGQTVGQGVGGVWYVLSATGDQVESKY